MSFTSYALDFHDVTLWRALGQLAAGSYIDAGDTGSGNTSLGRAFQEQGWRGVHRAANGGLVLLDAMFDACAPGPVHWLRLVANDLDAGLLNTWQRADSRPWIIVVSSAGTAPAAWHRRLEQKGYVLAGSTVDTLFYALRAPAVSGLHLDRLPQPQPAPPQRDDVTAQLQAERIAGLQRQLDAVFASTSWRVTKPLRLAMRLHQSPGPAVRELVALSRRKAKELGRRAFRAIVSRPSLRRIARDLDQRFPALARRLRARLHGMVARQPEPVTAVPPAADPAGVIGPRFRALLLDDLAHCATLKGKA